VLDPNGNWRMAIFQKNNWLRKFGFMAVRFSGLPLLFRQLVQKRKVTILLFHDISVKTAEQTFGYLAKKYNIISLENFLHFHTQKNATIPERAMVITFDDGFARNFELLPVFKKYNLPVTVFLCAGLVNTNRHFWFEENHSRYHVNELKKMGNNEKLTILAEAGFSNEKEYDVPQVLSKVQIGEMKKTVNFQSHGLFHPCLPKCLAVESKNEIESSKKILESEYGLEVNAFAYPNGDYSGREVQFIKNAGYTCALTVDYGFNSAKTDLFRLKRICVNDAEDMNELVVKSSGLWEFFKTRNGRSQKYGWTDEPVS
jgi:peptidoglycan/xylan/chitin deacetylase (PgdA/CDA1 family)